MFFLQGHWCTCPIRKPKHRCTAKRPWWAEFRNRGMPFPTRQRLIPPVFSRYNIWIPVDADLECLCALCTSCVFCLWCIPSFATGNVADTPSRLSYNIGSQCGKMLWHILDRSSPITSVSSSQIPPWNVLCWQALSTFTFRWGVKHSFQVAYDEASLIISLIGYSGRFPCFFEVQASRQYQHWIRIA